MILKHIAMLNEKFSVTAISEMQTGSNAENVNKIGSYNYASFETDSIDVDNPRPLKRSQELALSSSDCSLSDGSFLTPVSFSTTFDKAVSFIGITINTDVLIEDIKIELYTGDTLISVLNYYGDNNFFEVNASDVSKIIFTINKINKPKVFLDVFGINFGRVVFWDESNIKDVKMVNNFSNVGRDLAIDTLNFTIPNFTDKIVFEENQRLEVLDDDGMCKYTFYLKSYKYNDDKTKVELEYADVIEVLDKVPFTGMYFDTTAYKAINDIFDDIDSEFPYNIDPEIASLEIQGEIPTTTMRNALIYIANATGCKILKHPNLQFVKQTEFVKKTFGDDNVFLGSVQHTKETPTREIEFTTYTYSEVENPTEHREMIVDRFETSRIGSFSFRFDGAWSKVWLYLNYNDVANESSWQPNYLDSYIIKSNRVRFTLNQPGIIVYIMGVKYIKNKFTSTSRIDNYYLYHTYERQSIDSFTLMLKSDWQSRVNDLLDYYKKRETITFKAIWDNPSFNGYVDFYGEKKRVKKITTSFGDVVELEVE